MNDIQKWVICPHCGSEEAKIDDHEKWKGKKARANCPDCGEREFA